MEVLISELPFWGKFKKNFKYVILTLILILLAGITGYYFGRYLPFSKVTPDRETNSSSNISQLSVNHTATIYATIVSVDGSSITVTDREGQKATIALSSSLTIFTPSSSREATASSDLKSIEINKEALIIAEFRNGQYQVMSISYQFRPPPLKPNNNQ